MAGSIKGITVEIGGDATKLDKALQGVNAKSRDLQSELRQVDKLLKLDPSNVTLVAQKQKLLTEAVQNTSAKLETLKTAEKQAQEQFKKGEISEEQYRALQREIVATEQKLNGYQNELREVGAESKKTAASTKEIGDSATKTTPHMKNFSAGSVAAIAAIGAAAVAAVAAIKNIAEKVKDAAFGMAEYADEVNTLAAKYKVSSGTIQEWMYIAKIADTEVEVMGGSLAKLVRAINSAERGTEDQVNAFKALGVEYKKSNGKFRDTEDVFYDLVDALGKMDDETQADIYANALFSRSFQDLNPLIATGSEGIKDLAKKAEDLGLVLGDEQLAKLNAFQDSIDTLQSQVKIAAAPFVEGLIPAFQKVAGVISEKLSDPKVQDTLKRLGGKLGDIAAKITDKLIDFLDSDTFGDFADGIIDVGDALTEEFIDFVNNGLPMIKNTLSWMVTHKAEISDIMTAISVGMIAIGVASGNVMLALGGMVALTGTGLTTMNGYLEENKGVLDDWSKNNDLRLGESEGFWNTYFEKQGNNLLDNLDYLKNDAPEYLKKWAEDNGLYTDQSLVAWDNFKLTALRYYDEFVRGVRGAFNGMKLSIDTTMGNLVLGIKVKINEMIGFVNDFISSINNMIGAVRGVTGVRIPFVQYLQKINYNAEGVLFDKPTLLPTVAGLQMVGEAGAEITAPLAKLQNLMINTAKETGGGKTVNITINPQSMTDAQWRRGVTIIREELGLGYA